MRGAAGPGARGEATAGTHGWTVTGASEDGVFRWSDAEAALSGSFAVDALSGLSLPGDGMISDLHGSGDYRAHLVAVMTKRAVAALT